MCGAPVILFTDFGTKDFYVGQMHARLAQAARGVNVVDLHHHAPAFTPGLAGLLLEALVPFLPDPAVIVGVVDPGVGTDRGTLALKRGERWFVGPDNGLFGSLLDVPGVEAYRLAPNRSGTVSDSFHGRDIFAPAAGALATGDQRVLGEPVEAPLRAEAPRNQVVYVDHYGNLMTGLAAPLEAGGRLRLAGRMVEAARTFGEVAPGELFWYRNSLDRVEVAARETSAAALLGVGPGAEVAWGD
jgi:hypothetical protein